MPIDPSIYNMVGKFPQVEIPDPLERQTRLAQLKQLANQGLMTDMAMADAQAKRAREARAKDLLAKNQGDVQKAAQEATAAGDYETASEFQTLIKSRAQTDAVYQKSVSEAQEAFLKASKEERAAVQAGLEDLAKGIQWVEQGDLEELPARYARFVQHYPPQVREKYGMGPQYDPSIGGLIKARAQAWGDVSKVGEREKFEESRRHNMAMEKKPSSAIVAMGKPPAGYRYTGDGSLEPIPGGPADRKIAAEEQKKEGVKNATMTTIETGRRLLNHPGLAGSVGKWNLERKIPGTDAASFAAELDSFKAQNFIPAVQAMKGMGQLSDAEGRKLTDAIGALDYSMKESDFKASLARIITRLEEAATREPTKRQTQPQAAKSAPTGVKTTVKDGKTYYLWPSDGNYHTMPPS